jgi:hypothetical protein
MYPYVFVTVILELYDGYRDDRPIFLAAAVMAELGCIG